MLSITPRSVCTVDETQLGRRRRGFVLVCSSTPVAFQASTSGTPFGARREFLKG